MKFFVVLIALLLGAPQGLDAPIPYHLFRMLEMTPHYKSGVIIVPPWLKEDTRRTPEMYWNLYKKGTDPGKSPFLEPDLRRI